MANKKKSKIGDAGEAAARKYLEQRGYHIRHINWRYGHYELDIVAEQGHMLIIVEVKKHTEVLDKHSSQLYRYFGVTDAKFALLTNGVEYRFYSDINKENKLDDSPFLIVNLDELNKRDVKALERFTKSSLNIDSILEMANKQRYILEIKKIFEEETARPSDDLARIFAGRILPQGTRITGNILDEFRAYTKSALGEIVADLASKKINSIRAGLTANITDESEENSEDETKIVTTQEELQGFFIVKSILGEHMELGRIYARDTKSYFGILFVESVYYRIGSYCPVFQSNEHCQRFECRPRRVEVGYRHIARLEVTFGTVIQVRYSLYLTCGNLHQYGTAPLDTEFLCLLHQATLHYVLHIDI